MLMSGCVKAKKFLGVSDEAERLMIYLPTPDLNIRLDAEVVNVLWKLADGFRWTELNSKLNIETSAGCRSKLCQGLRFVGGRVSSSMTTPDSGRRVAMPNNGKWRMNDVLVILPGITGSVLKKENTPIWAPAPKALMHYFLSLGRSIEWLCFEHDDPEYDDGVRATDLIPFTLVPGLARFDGYTGLKRHLFDGFNLTVGHADQIEGPAANYFEFPYDWRRTTAYRPRD